jgi:hypothetical protein
MPTGAAGVSTKWHGLIVEYNWNITWVDSGLYWDYR